jgi:hypothetical protein
MHVDLSHIPILVLPYGPARQTPDASVATTQTLPPADIKPIEIQSLLPKLGV